MPFIESEAEFSTRHGGNAVRADNQKGGRRVFLLPDGAQIVHDPMGGVHLVEPPPDPDSKEALAARKRYLAIRLHGAEFAFRQCKAALLGDVRGGQATTFAWDQDQFGPEPAEDHNSTFEARGIPSLLRLKAIAGELREQIRSIDDKVNDLPENMAMRERAEALEAQREATRQRQEAERAEIMGVHLRDEVEPQGTPWEQQFS